MRLVLIKWRDITSWSGWHDELLREGRDEPEVFYTVGFLARKTKDKVTICDSNPGVGNVTVFPMGCIDSIEYLSVELPPEVRNYKAPK